MWTGSCPASPSAPQERASASTTLGTSGLRVRPHRAVPPPVVFGEQVASPTASSGSTLFRLTWKAQATPLGRPICALVASVPHTSGSGSTSWPSPTASLADKGVRTERRADRSQAREESRPGGGGASGIVEHADAERARRQRGELSGAQGSGPSSGEKLGVSLTAGFGNMEGRDWWRRGEPGVTSSQTGVTPPCDDGKARPVEPGTFPLAHGIPNRVGRVRAYGNAIVPQVAATFIRAVMESM